jgi:hypothetical protein
MLAEWPWAVELKLVIFYGPLASQAAALVAQVQAHTRVVGTTSWRSTPGALGGEDERRALTIDTVVLAADATDAASTADQLLGEAIRALVLGTPPCLTAPVLAEVGDVRAVRGGTPQS